MPASVSSYAPPARTRWRKSPPETALQPTTRAGPRQLLSHPTLRQPEHDGGKAHQKQHFTPQHAQAHASFCLILRSASQNTMAEKPTRNSTSTHNTRRPTPFKKMARTMVTK